MSGSKSLTVGVIGLGIIGSRVAECLRRARHDVFVWNRTSRAEPNFLSSPAEVAEVTQYIQIFVRDADALLEVMKDMQPALKKTHVICAHATVSPLAMNKAYAIADEVGAGFIDAPFTGSKAAAEKGELVYYLSGNEREQEKARPFLEASSKKIVNFGPKVGDATVLKIATNLVSANVVQALAEALAITQSQGISGAQLLEAFQNNANCSPLVTMKLPAMMSGAYEPHFSLKNMLKDGRYAHELAKEKNILTPALTATVAAMEQAERAGKGEQDYSVVFENLQTPTSVVGSILKPESKPPPVKKQTRITLKASTFEMEGDNGEDDVEVEEPKKGSASGS
jgi:3-hydroxyisobutyrate dehydrogenase-like beta-hydroxyacid dehydrogenase